MVAYDLVGKQGPGLRKDVRFFFIKTSKQTTQTNKRKWLCYQGLLGQIKKYLCLG